MRSQMHVLDLGIWEGLRIEQSFKEKGINRWQKDIHLQHYLSIVCSHKAVLSKGVCMLHPPPNTHTPF